MYLKAVLNVVAGYAQHVYTLSSVMCLGYIENEGLPLNCTPSLNKGLYMMMRLIGLGFVSSWQLLQWPVGRAARRKRKDRDRRKT